MKIIWAGTFEPGFSRNRKLARLLEIAGADVTVVREPLWGDDRVGLATGGWSRTAFSALWKYPRLLLRLLKAGRPDLYLVSYPGWFDMPVVRLAAWLRRRPVVFDPFISLYDTMISDRRLHSDRSALARVATLVDRWSLRLSSRIVADTPPHLLLFDTLAPGVGSRGDVLPIGADDEVFTPRPDVEIKPRLVTFHGTFVPLQGLETIVEAAALLEPEGIRTVIIGDGQDRPAVETAIRRTGVNVELIGLLPLEQLPERLAPSTVCLGVFGDSEKAGRVVPHKVYECLAMGLPVVTRDGPAIGAMFGEDELVTVPPSEPIALANAIRSLIVDPARRHRVASAGLKIYRERFHEEPLAALLVEILESAVD
ncbi:MAG: glycosyltransferase [Acidimicrobiia bacterium]